MAGRRVSRRDFIVSTAGAVALASRPAGMLARPAEVDAGLGAKLAADLHRPQYHFLPAANWMNDPNGPIYWKGVYHMFYQYNPNGAFWGDMHWGHAESPDMIHWQHLPVALAPTPGGPDKDGCFSGSAVNHGGVPTLIYTGVSPEVQCLATSQDMIAWQKFAKNPVIAGPPTGLTVTGFRDPAPWKEGETWMLGIGSGFKGAGGAVLLYESENLTEWKYLHTLSTGTLDPSVQSKDPVATAEMWECPDFFPLGQRHVMLISTQYKVRYYVGQYENRRFQKGARRMIDSGAYYAAKSMMDGKGRRILWGWIQERRSVAAQKAAGWSGVLSLPRVLSLREDGMVGMEPIPEIASLRGGKHELGERDVKGEFVSLPGACGETLEIIAELDPGSSAECGLVVRAAPEGSERTRIVYRRESGKLVFDSTHSSLDPQTTRGVDAGALELGKGENLKLRVFLDGSVIEIFANGRACLTGRVYPTKAESVALGLTARGGVAKLVSLKTWEMRPISPDRLAT
jgi:beta-fructofuranosidase